MPSVGAFMQDPGVGQRSDLSLSLTPACSPGHTVSLQEPEQRTERRLGARTVQSGDPKVTEARPRPQCALHQDAGLQSTQSEGWDMQGAVPGSGMWRR